MESNLKKTKHSTENKYMIERAKENISITIHFLMMTIKRLKKRDLKTGGTGREGSMPIKILNYCDLDSEKRWKIDR